VICACQRFHRAQKSGGKFTTVTRLDQGYSKKRGYLRAVNRQFFKGWLNTTLPAACRSTLTSSSANSSAYAESRNFERLDVAAFCAKNDPFKVSTLVDRAWLTKQLQGVAAGQTTVMRSGCNFSNFLR